MYSFARQKSTRKAALRSSAVAKPWKPLRGF